MRVQILAIDVHPLASMQLHLQGLDDGSVQSQFRLADAAVVDLMLRTIDTQLMIAKPLI